MGNKLDVEASESIGIESGDVARDVDRSPWGILSKVDGTIDGAWATENDDSLRG